MPDVSRQNSSFFVKIPIPETTMFIFGFSTREMRTIFRYCYKGCGKILQFSGKIMLMILNPEARD